MARYDILTTLLLNSSNYNQGLNQAKQSSRDFERGVQQVSGGIKSAFTGMLAVVGGGVTVFEAVKKTIGATQGTADAFEATIAGMNTAADAFFKTLSSGDWSNFLENIMKANKAGREYASVMDEIGDRQRSQDIYSATEQTKLKGFEEIFRSTSLPSSVRQKALDDYKSLMTSILNTQRRINQEILDAEQNKYSTLSGLDKQNIDYVLSNYDREIEKIRNANENIQQYLNLKNASTTQSSGMYSYTVVDPNAEKNASEFYDNLSKDQQQWFDRMMAYNKLNDGELEKIKQAKLNLLNVDNEIANLNVTLVRQQNSIYTASEAEAKEAEKIAKSKKEQAELDRQRANVEGLTSLTSLSSSGVVLSPGEHKRAEDAKKLIPVDFQAEIEKFNQQVRDAWALIQSRPDLFTDEYVEEFKSKYGEIIKENADLSESFYVVQDAANEFSNSLIQGLSDGQLSFEDFMNAIVTGLIKLVTGLMVQAIAGIFANEASTKGLPGLATGAAGAGIATGIFTGLIGQLQFAGGGIVPGYGNYDNVPALLTPGEVVMNSVQQSNLWDFIQGNAIAGGVNGRIEVEIEDRKLVGVLENYSKYNQIARGRRN